MFKIAFWKKESGSFMTASKGLTQEEVEALQQLRAGDRLILKTFASHTKLTDNSPDARLEVYIKPGKDNL